MRLDPERIDIDVARFRSAAGDFSSASEALTLYRGALLEDFPLRPKSRSANGLAPIASVCVTSRGR